MKMSRDNEVYELIKKGIDLSKNFRTEFEDEHKLSSFLALLDSILNIVGNPDSKFKNPRLQERQQLYLSCLNENGNDDGSSSTFSTFTDSLEERALAWKRKEPAKIILDNSPYWCEALKAEEDATRAQQEADPDDDSPLDGIWADMDKFITVGTMEEFSKKIPDFYKNFMSEEDQKVFANMLEFIRNELRLYSENLVYVNKIVPALNEYSEKGAFPTQTIFLNHYLTMAVLNMVSVASKLFSVTNGEKAFGFAYLKNWLGKKYNTVQEVRLVLSSEDVKEQMKRGEGYRQQFEDVRNQYLAHYDPRNLDVLKTFRIEQETLKEIYDLCVNMLERFSFKYFHRHEQYGYGLFIEFNGFEFICRNPWVSPKSRCDIDDFLDILKKTEIENLRICESDNKEIKN